MLQIVAVINAVTVLNINYVAFNHITVVLLRVWWRWVPLEVHILAIVVGEWLWRSTWHNCGEDVYFGWPIRVAHSVTSCNFEVVVVTRSYWLGCWGCEGLSRDTGANFYVASKALVVLNFVVDDCRATIADAVGPSETNYWSRSQLIVP